jgi:hypothetical protein
MTEILFQGMDVAIHVLLNLFGIAQQFKVKRVHVYT